MPSLNLVLGPLETPRVGFAVTRLVVDGGRAQRRGRSYLRVCLHLVAVALLVLAPLPARAQDTPAGPCDDLASQVDAVSQQLNEEQQNAQASLIQAGQAAPIVLSELTVAAAQGAPNLTPDLAASLGGLAVQVGAQIEGWRSSGASIRELPGQLLAWETTLASLAPYAGYSPNLAILNTALMQLDQVAANVVADGTLQDSLSAQLQECQRQHPPAEDGSGSGPSGSGGTSGGGGLCTVGDASGASASECFTLELNSALAAWTVCTEAYFAAEDEAFRTGGDPPANTCDPAFKQAQDAIQQRWGTPDPAP